MQGSEGPPPTHTHRGPLGRTTARESREVLAQFPHLLLLCPAFDPTLSENLGWRFGRGRAGSTGREVSRWVLSPQGGQEGEAGCPGSAGDAAPALHPDRPRPHSEDRSGPTWDVGAAWPLDPGSLPAQD